MATIAGNSANKSLADFGTNQKRGGRPQTATKKVQQDNLDDSRSDAASCMSYATSSNFSSVLKRGGPGGPTVGSFNHDNISVMSSAVSQSQISYEEGFPNAEFNAVNEEDRARRRKEEKDLKLKEFMDKTKRSA